MGRASSSVRRPPAGVDAYLADMDAIPGWFTELDARLMRTLLAGQASRGVGGDVLEIGVYQGRSACFLGFLLRADEALHVCDPFEPTASDEPNTLVDAYRAATRQVFETNFRGMHPWLPEIHACRSDELVGRLEPASFRFVHVDGSHAYEDVACDIELVASLLVPGGIVCMDDYRCAHTPGVALATWAAVAAGTLRPVCITDDKLYAVRGDDATAPALRADVEAEGRLVPEEHRLVGEGPVLRVQLRPSVPHDPWSRSVRVARRYVRAARRRIGHLARRR